MIFLNMLWQSLCLNATTITFHEPLIQWRLFGGQMPWVFSRYAGAYPEGAAGVAVFFFFFFALHLTLGGKRMIFKEPVLLFRSENISGRASMTLKCAPFFSNSWTRPCWAMLCSQLILVTSLLRSYCLI